VARLNDTRTEPPGGWRYVQSETGCAIEAGSFPELLEKLAIHRKYKSVGSTDPAEMAVEIENQLCQGLDPRFCRAEEGETYLPTVDQTRSLTSTKATAFSKSVFVFLAGDDPIVSKEVSESRAAICRGCQFNRSAASCACSAFNKLISALVPKKRVEPGVDMCAACGCSLRAKLLLPDAVVQAGNEGRDIRFPSHCWQK
jgi:hypothetical protein